MDNGYLSEIIIAIIGAIAGGGLTGVFTMRANKRKAEADAMTSVQEVYQKVLDDQEKYAEKLRESRDHIVADREQMRKENNDLRQRLNDMDEKVRQLEHDVARNGRMVESLRPFLCGRIGCKDRIKVDLGSSDTAPEPKAPVAKPARKPKKPQA